MQTEKPYWLSEAYGEAITKQDVGLVRRNINLSTIIKNIIIRNFDVGGRYIDWGGGYGLFTRLMRDIGFDFHHKDDFCKNIFAQSFEATGRFEVLTNFEVLEHLENPLEEFEKMFAYSDTLIFTEELIPKNVLDWWYIAPEHGQHVSFYSKKALEFIANKFGAKLYSRENIHCLTRTGKKIKLPAMEISKYKKFLKKLKNRFEHHVLGLPFITPLTGKDFRNTK